MLDGHDPAGEAAVLIWSSVSTEVRRLSRLVRNMLEISRLKDQGHPGRQAGGLLDLREAAGQALLSFEQRINRKHLNVDVDMPETLGDCAGHAGRRNAGALITSSTTP